jgi:hypothetical protein
VANKIVLFYNQLQEGWTETYYDNTNNSPLTVARAIYNAGSLINFVQYRHYTTELWGIRVTQIGGSRTNFSINTAGQLLTGDRIPVGNADETPDVTSTSWVLKLGTSPQTQTRHIWLRGLNDVDTLRDDDGEPNPSTYLQNGWARQLLAIQTFGWNLQYEIRPPNGGLVWNYVTSVASAGPNTSTVFLSAAPNLNLVANPQVVFQGIPRDDLPGFPRQPTVISQSNVAPFNIVITYRYRASVTPYIPAKLKFCPAVYGYFPISNFYQVEFEERKTGRPFGTPRGRARGSIRAL